MQTHYRACNLCEAICGLEIKVEDGKVMSIAGDKNDPFSRGHICPKAVALKDIYEDPNRLKFPMKRTENGWLQISWEQAFEEVVTNLKNIQAKYGNDAVGVYQGNPSIHNSGTFMTAPYFFKTLRTKNMFSATSADQLPHHFAAWQMFGHPMLMPIPDIDYTDFMVIIGGNPIASNGSIMTVPDVEHRLKAIQKRGGKIVVIDPRRTETAAKADKHLFIKPNNDVFLLLAMINVIFAENKVNLSKLSDFTDELDVLRQITAEYIPEKVVKLTGISAYDIRQLTLDFANAPTAVCYGRVGVSTQAFGTLSLWLINAINVITGNLDKQGGSMFTLPAVDFLARSKNENRFNRWQSRVRGLPEFSGELPVAVMAEEMQTEGEGRIRAMMVSCGNPVLSTPNGVQLDEAFADLEYMVAFDIYINETTRHANLILPPATGLEVAHYDMTFNVLAVRNTTKYSEPTFEKTEGAKFDWEIFDELRQRMLGDEDIKLTNPEEKIDLGLKFGPYQLSLQALKDNPHGIDLGEMKPCLPNRLLTSDKRIKLAPEILVKDMERLYKVFENAQTDSNFNLLLIGRRHLRDNNSWMHNSHRLVKGNNRCTLMMHSKDAEKIGIENHQIVSVISRVGEIEIPAEITDTMMEGVVCMPHGYGHHRAGIQMDIAAQHAGVSVNDLTDELYLDDLTGNAAFNGVAVRVEALVEV
jgi:anaerobic selenocysteine-containing dehydrogenase